MLITVIVESRRRYKDDQPTNPDTFEATKTSRNFSRNHAMSIHLNLITVVATLLYGWRLGCR